MEDKVDKILCKLREACLKYKIVIFFFIGISMAIYIYSWGKADQDIQKITQYYNDEMTMSPIVNEEIIVHIDGAVITPGVYSLKSGDRVNDLIKLAGGLCDNANIKNINLARKVNDGEKIYIYTIDEIVEDISENDTISSGKININSASKSLLMSLPGIGDNTANKIIEYRKNNIFKRIEDIKNVSGIGESKYNSIKDLIDIK